MNARDGLIALAAQGVATSVLPACRLESSGLEAFGAEAIADQFRRAPLKGTDPAFVIEEPGHIALFGDGEALVADLFDAQIGRLWRIGQASPGAAEPAVAVAFDTDLRQARASVFFSAGDHPALAGDGAVRVQAAGLELAGDEDANFRTRAFVVRAFGDGTGGCALFAVHALGANPVRTPSLNFAAVRWQGDTRHWVRDAFRPRELHVRIAG